MGTSAPQPPGETVEVYIGERHHDRRLMKTDLSAGIAGAVAASRQVLAGGDVRAMIGYAIRETTGTAGAVIRFHDGNGPGTEVIAPVSLAAGESDRSILGSHGITVSTGRIFLEVVSGSVEGVVYWARKLPGDE